MPRDGSSFLVRRMLSCVQVVNSRCTYIDAIYYGSSEFKPKTLIDVATLTGYVAYRTSPLSYTH